MAHDPLDGPLRGLAQLGALALGATALALLGLALAGELLRGRRRAPAFIAALERWLPDVARAAAVSLLASLAMWTRPAGASDDGVRAWLRSDPPTTTTTVPRPTVATPDALERRGEPPLPAPVVLAPRPAPPVVPPSPPEIPPPAIVYRVAPGDCLWSIAARHLGAGATNQLIDRGWRAIYAANRAAVGADPGLIRPGLVLSLPPLEP